MPKKQSCVSRRNFLKVTGLTGVGAIVAPVDQLAKASEVKQTIPTRSFGKSGIKVPILSFKDKDKKDKCLLFPVIHRIYY